MQDRSTQALKNDSWMNSWMVLEEVLDKCSFKVTKISKIKIKMQETKIMLGIKTTPWATQIHDISKMVIRHL